MKHFKFLFFFVISTLFLIGCRTDNVQSGTVNQPNPEVESQSETLKEVSQEAFVKTKEIETIDIDSKNQTPEKEDAEELSKVSQSKNEANQRGAQKIAKKSKPSKRLRPKITFDSIIHHLPTITRGETFAHEFKFKNTGDAPLSILLAVPSCGCTLPSYPFLDIPPDSSGVIGLEYNSVGKHGKQEAEITITANTRPKETVLTMVFDVEEPEEETKINKDTLSN